MLQRSYNDYLSHLNKDNSNSLSDWLVVLKTRFPDPAHSTLDEGTFFRGSPSSGSKKERGQGKLTPNCVAGVSWKNLNFLPFAFFVSFPVNVRGGQRATRVTKH